jgi:hypothetical protein
MDKDDLREREIAACRGRLVEAARAFLTLTGNQPFSAALSDGEPLILAVGPRRSVISLLSTVERRQAKERHRNQAIG